MKTKSTILSVIISLFIINPAISQLQNFDLTKYKLPNYKRQGLDFSFYGNGNYSKWDWDSDIFSSNYLTKEYNSNFKMNFFSEVNTRKRQQFIEINGDFTPYNFSETKSSSISNTKNSRITSINLNLNLNNKFYNSNNFFFEIGARSNCTYNYNYSKNKTVNNTLITRDIIRDEGTYSTSNVTFGIGKGRIENIEDARLAIYILDDLYVQNKLSRQPSEEEILIFAAKITQLKNKRFFDTRIRKIYEIQVLDTFLRNNKLVKDCDAIYFTSVNDNWNYSNNPIRQYGQRVSLEIIPSYKYFYSNYENSTLPNDNRNYNDQAFAGQIMLEYLNNKPQGLKWQRNISANLGFGRSWQWFNNENVYDYNTNSLFAIANYEYGYYPNSRSYYTLGLFGQYNKYWYKREPDFNPSSNNNCYLGSLISLYYYISERFKLSGSTSIRYLLNKSKDSFNDNKSKNISYYFSTSLTYSLF